MLGRSKINKIKDLKAMSLQNVNASHDDYSVGVTNGVELALALLEDREPELICTVNDAPILVETKHEEKRGTGRTTVTGIRRS